MDQERIKTIDSISFAICRKTNSLDMLDDVKQEMYLLLFQGRVGTDKSIILEVSRYVNKYSDRNRVYMDMDIYTKTGVVSGSREFKKYFNIAHTPKCYELYADNPDFTFEDVGKALGFKRSWAQKNVKNSIHLPIVSTKLKNRVLEKIEVQKRKAVDKVHAYNKKVHLAPNAILTENLIPEIFKLKNVVSSEEVRIQYGVSRRAIQDIWARRTWRHIHV